VRGHMRSSSEASTISTDAREELESIYGGRRAGRVLEGVEYEMLARPLASHPVRGEDL